MTEQQRKLQSLFEPAARYANFGDVITSVQVQGIRCHRNTSVEIESPITAFCGLNGTGKSTLLQLAAVAYQSPDEHLTPNYSPKDFVVVGKLDPNPFTPNARIVYQFWQSDRSLKARTLSKSPSSRNSWQGLSRRPPRHVFFAGIGLYLPRIEKRDFILRRANSLTIQASQKVNSRIHDWISRILGYKYDDVQSHSVKHEDRIGQIVTVDRSGVRYSEAHMGFGEGRTQHLIASLELLPDRSLVLIEEPETSLHPSAQYYLGQYLVDVAIEKKHQVFLTTHSEAILEALPEKSRLYLRRSDNDIQCIRGLTVLEARSLMTDTHKKSLYIIVEDPVAKAILLEMVRRVDLDFARTVMIHPGGSYELVKDIVKSLKGMKLPVTGILDSDQATKAVPKDNIFSLPGENKPPEKQLFDHPKVAEFIAERYSFQLSDFRPQLPEDHHHWIPLLALQLNVHEQTLLDNMAKVYVDHSSETEIANIVRLLREVKGTL